MARDAGGPKPAGAGLPFGVDGETFTEIVLTDDLPAGGTGYVYLVKAPAAAPPPGYVTYVPRFAAGSYKAAYQVPGGPHRETSSLDTPYYHQGFSDRWIRDRLQLGAVADGAPDLLDRDKVQFMPNFCERSEGTFSGYDTTDGSPGGFIANIDGPVRAIRSYFGANSGSITQRDHFVYDRREDVVTRLRVHQIPGIMSFLDFSSVVRDQLTYQAKRASDGALSPAVDIAGTPDALFSPPPPPQDPTRGPALAWELVTGDPGSIIRASRLATEDLTTPPDTVRDFEVVSYYEDDLTPTRQCTGDTAAIGSSGIRVRPKQETPGPDLIPCTDPQRFTWATCATRTGSPP